GGGLGALDEFFRHPPESTEQILHPEKSAAPRDVPSRIDDDLAGSGVPPGARIVKRGTMGEFGIRFLLGGSAPDAIEAAEGWDGDRFVLARAGEASILNWVTAWDSGTDAAEFAAAARRWLDGRGASRGAADVRIAGTVVIVAEGGGGTSGSPPPGER